MNISISKELPSDPPEWCDIFNTVAFFNLYKTSHSLFLSFLNEGQLIGCIHFTEIEPGVYKSPYRGTYGSFDFIENTHLDTIKLCVEMTSVYLKTELNVQKVIITTPPFAHDHQSSSYIFNTLLNLGFDISNHEVNYTLSVDDTALVNKMMRNNKKRYNKCLRGGFSFEQVNSEEEYNIIYEVIKANRGAKGYPLTMTFEQIMYLYKIFPDRLYFFKAKKENVSAAAALCIKLNNDVLYVFYWGHLPGFEEYSPVAFLANGIYEFAKENDFKMIDAGTSSLNGEPNFGVITFKENLGFTASLKLTYSKTYE